MQADDNKAKELILFIALESEDDPGFGMVKLNKLLFASDFSAYLHRHEPITGQEYQKIQFGPALRRMLPLLSELRQAGHAEVQKATRFDQVQDRIIALRDPDLSLFGGEEIALVERAIKRF